MNPPSLQKCPRFEFRYREQVVKNQATGSEETFAHPWLPCTLEWRGRKTAPTEGLLDSGSDGLVLPLGIARFLGLDLKEEEVPMHALNQEVPQFTAIVDLRIGRAGRFHIFPNVVAHVPMEGDPPILIGRDPVFKAYRVIFDDSKLKFVLEPSGSHSSRPRKS